MKIWYEIQFNATEGRGGSGSFTVDSSVLPSTGYYESSPYVFSLEHNAKWNAGLLAGLYFGDVWRNGFAMLIAADGQASGVTGIGNDGLISFTPFMGYEEHELVLECAGTWTLNSHSPSVKISERSIVLASGNYTISKVPLIFQSSPQILSVKKL